MVSKVLDKTGVKVRAGAMMYKEVVKTVLLNGIESWVITEAMMKVLEDFHHKIARNITGKTACCV